MTNIKEQKGSSPGTQPEWRRKSIILRHNHTMLPAANYLLNYVFRLKGIETRLLHSLWWSVFRFSGNLLIITVRIHQTTSMLYRVIHIDRCLD